MEIEGGGHLKYSIVQQHNLQKRGKSSARSPKGQSGSMLLLKRTGKTTNFETEQKAFLSVVKRNVQS